MDRNEKFIKSTEKEREIMATASFSKQFVVSSKTAAAKVHRALKSNASTVKTSNLDIRKDLNRGEELLKQFLSR